MRHTRWVPAAGALDHVFDDELVPGTTGIPQRLLRGIEPFPTSRVVPYDTAYLSGFVVERYQVDLEQAAAAAGRQMQSHLEMLCARQVPGDTHRNLRVRTAFSQQTFKHTLVPIWLLTYTYGTRAFQVVANGFTGAIAGEYPKSAWKIAGVVLVALLILALILIAQD